jgi:hypothetical protein
MFGGIPICEEVDACGREKLKDMFWRESYCDVCEGGGSTDEDIRLRESSAQCHRLLFSKDIPRRSAFWPIYGWIHAKCTVSTCGRVSCVDRISATTYGSDYMLYCR